MGMMKAVTKRRGGGHSKPLRRKSFPNIEQEKLDQCLEDYVRVMGSNQAFNVHEYSHLQAQQAEVPKAIYKLQHLLHALLDVSPTAEIKYANLKQSLIAVCKKFGYDTLQAHFQGQKEHVPGTCADALLVLLKHWRRITNSANSWEKFQLRLEQKEAQTLDSLYKKMTEKPKRKLAKHESEVTVGSDGFPAMLQSSSEPTPSQAETADSDSAQESPLEHSPPPVLKKDWREKAGKVLKRPGSKQDSVKKDSVKKGSVKKDSVKKKPSGSTTSSKPKGTEEDTSMTRGGPDCIDTSSLILGGGKVQSYIQHRAGGAGTPLKLIAACTLNQASRLKVTHKRLMEELLPFCKKGGATKTSVLEAREKLFDKFRKGS